MAQLLYCVDVFGGTVLKVADLREGLFHWDIGVEDLGDLVVDGGLHLTDVLGFLGHVKEELGSSVAIDHGTDDWDKVSLEVEEAFEESSSCLETSPFV